ncbi:hypothetical protein BDK92_7295 [Micromonospora pisi]|uniref:Uncharacterized protein n=1 Tax=Micromonospora pisi TaxID=589240 RepID=A0A495JUZ5_9ACTN|nr:hypothetical protein [Micromonospora pisi]RKR92813.1 hypothetical protein BDK92_7295 [Micromonospora pisi]
MSTQLSLMGEPGVRTERTEYRVIASALTYEPVACQLHENCTCRCSRVVAPAVATGDGGVWATTATRDQAELIAARLYAPALIETHTIVTYTTNWTRS